MRALTGIRVNSPGLINLMLPVGNDEHFRLVKTKKTFLVYRIRKVKIGTTSLCVTADSLRNSLTCELQISQSKTVYFRFLSRLMVFLKFGNL